MGLGLFHHPLPLEKDLSSNPMLLLHHHYVDVCGWMVSIKYGPFQLNYNTIKDKWNMHELHIMLVQEETRLKNHGNHSIHCVNNQGAGKKVFKKHGKGK